MRRLVQSALALVLVVAGCAKAGNSLKGVETLPCSRDSDCSAGQVCLDVGCAAPDVGLAVQVQPSSHSGLLTQEFGGIDVRKGSIDLSLGASGGFTFFGNIVPFDVSLTGHSLVIPDVTESVQGTVTQSGAVLQVPQGSYTLVASPTDGNSPPTVLAVDLTKPGVNPNATVTFFEQSQLVELHGSLKSGLMGTPTNPDPSFSFGVQAFGAGLNGLPQSQTCTANVNNHFSFQIWVAPQSQPTDSVSVVVNPTSGPGPRVTFTRPFSSFQQESAQPNGLVLNLGDGLHTEVVNGQVLDDTGAPVPNATITLDGTGPDSTQGSFAFHSATATTDAVGNFTITALFDDARLIQYSAVVVPPQGSHLASARFAPQPVPPGSNNVRIFPGLRLEKATLASGRVLDDKGTPVFNASVRAEPASATGDVPLQAVETTTDASGSFTLELTPGTYHFTFKPPFELNLPFNARTFDIAGASQSLPDLQFSAARVVSGTVRGPDGSAVEGAVIRVYRLALPGDAPSTRSTLLATGKVVTGGTFSLTLPAPRN